jgi:hypothetical protein
MGCKSRVGIFENEIDWVINYKAEQHLGPQVRIWEIKRLIS